MVRSARPILLAGAACSAALLATTLYGVTTAFGGGMVNWPVFGFEVITALAAIFGILTGLGRFSQGPSMALLCAAGAAVVGTGLSLVARQFPPMQVLAHPFFLLRFSLAVSLVIVAAAIALRREPSALRPLLAGVLCIVGTAAVGAALIASRALLGIDAVLVRVGGVVLILVLAISAGGLLAAGVHLVITAFERTRVPAEGPSPTHTPENAAS